MTDLALLAQPAVSALNQPNTTEDDLYRELGLRLKAMEADISISSSFTPAISRDIESQGAMDDLKKFGQDFFRRAHIQAYELICSTANQDDDQRQKMLDAFGVGRDAVGAVIAGIMISKMGVAPAIAPVLAALILRLAFKPGYEAMCAFWKERVPEH